MRRSDRPAALLLEVVVALAVLVTAIGLLSAQLAGGLHMTSWAEEQLRASLLADRILALVQLDPQMQRRMDEAEDLEDEFGKDYPGYFWRVHHQPLERESEDELRLITIQVLYQPDPDRPENIEGAIPVRELALIKAKPATVDLVEEAGLDEQAAELLRQAVPIPDFDPRAVDLHQLVALLDLDTIMELMPLLAPLLEQLAAGGMPVNLTGLAGDQLGEGAPLGGPAGQDLGEAIRQAAGAAGAGPQSPIPGAGAAPPRRGGPTAGGMSRPPRGGGRTQPPGGGAGPSVRPPHGQGRRGGDQGQPPPPPAGGGIQIGGGSGPNGEYTLEDLMRLRDEYERQQGAGP